MASTFMSKSNETAAARRVCSYDNLSAPHAVGQSGHSGAHLRQLASCPAGVFTLLQNITETERPRRRKHSPRGYVVVSEVAEMTHSPPSSIYAAIKSGRLRAASWRGLLVIATEDARDYAAIKPLKPVEYDAVGGGK